MELSWRFLFVQNVEKLNEFLYLDIISIPSITAFPKNMSLLFNFSLVFCWRKCYEAQLRLVLNLVGKENIPEVAKRLLITFF